jgi:hypothetical protein
MRVTSMGRVSEITFLFAGVGPNWFVTMGGLQGTWDWERLPSPPRLALLDDSEFAL